MIIVIFVNTILTYTGEGKDNEKEKKMFGLGMGELVIVLVLVVLLFGSKKIPELAKGLGQGIHEFKKSVADMESQTEEQKQTEKNKKV